MNLSRHLTAVGPTAFLLVAMLGAAAAGAEPSPASPSASPDELAELKLREQDAVALVLATDPRFAGIANWETLRIKGAQTFIPYPILESNYHVLWTSATDLAFPNVVPRAPSSSLIAVTLVRGCPEPTDSSSTWWGTEDPCSWRHSWYYRVEPDGVVTLLFDEGDPDDATGAPSLVGIEWTLKAIGTARLAGDPAWITFADDATLSGFGGCNVFTGPYTTTGSDIAIGPLRVSERVCAADVMEVEAVFLEALQAEPMWWITGDLLKIGTDDPSSPLMVTILTFQAADVPGG